jgi:hypothetical protein
MTKAIRREMALAYRAKVDFRLVHRERSAASRRLEGD